MDPDICYDALMNAIRSGDITGAWWRACNLRFRISDGMSLPCKLEIGGRPEAIAWLDECITHLEGEFARADTE